MKMDEVDIDVYTVAETDLGAAGDGAGGEADGGSPADVSHPVAVSLQLLILLPLTVLLPATDKTVRS